jgi:hypothetical protein
LQHPQRPLKLTVVLLAHEEEINPMAIHLTPTELAREAGMHRREVIAKCMELGVPIFQGRIDKTLFLSTLEASKRQQDELAKV